jgi:tripartite-type tricarboxylate transporter receptor subunit TctC
MKHSSLWALFTSCAVIFWLVGTAQSMAQGSYPVRPIRLLIPFPPGGAADTVGRAIGERLSVQLKQTVVIDNRPGAAGRLATGLLARAEPDGYTLLVGTPGAITIAPSLYKTLAYNVDRDILPVTLVAEVPNVIVVNPSTGVKSVREFINWAKGRPGTVRFGSSGTGQTDHLAGELFQRQTGVRMTHVPYKGGGPALIDLISGDIHVMFSTAVVALPHVTSGRLRVLAVTTAQRQALLPDLPTISETVAGFAISNWDGIFAPAKTPPHIADRLFVEIKKALQSADLRQRLNAAGIDPVGSASRADFVKSIRDETTQWARVVKDADIKVE